MTPQAKRHYWRAVEALREAEALASMTAKVSGPADAPPADGDADGWAQDWAKRAKRVLGKAHDWLQSPEKQLLERARHAARYVGKGARSVWKATGGKLAAKTKKALQAVADGAEVVSWATIIGSGVGTLALLALAWWAFKNTPKSRT